MITVKYNQKYIDKDTTFKYIDEFAVIDINTNEIYCVYKYVTESSIDKGYIVVYANGDVEYEILGKGATFGQVIKYDKFCAYQCSNIEINANVQATY